MACKAAAIMPRRMLFLSLQALGAGDLSLVWSAQDRVLEYISRSTFATRGEIEKLLGVSRSSAGNLLSAMVEGEMLKVEGAGRATTYRLA